MKGKIIIICLCLALISGKAISQYATIHGSTHVSPGAIEYYEAEFSYWPEWWANVQWYVQGGTIVYQSTIPSNGVIFVVIEWDPTISVGQGFISISENSYWQYGQTYVTIDNPIHAGYLFTGNYNFNYANPPVITQSPASGGGCNGGYNYMWEIMTDGINWVYFGSGEEIPSTLPPFAATTRIRRYVECNSLFTYSNELEFNYQSLSWENRNFIRTNEVWYAGKQNFIAADDIPIGQKQQSVVFYDGLGRPEQSVVVGASPETGTAATSKKDLVTPIEYDALGREIKKHLAYQSGTADGKFKMNALSVQQTFMNAKYPGESRYYAETELESSPLNRPLKVKAPGVNWGANGVGISTGYDLNGPLDLVRIWSIDPFTAGAIPVSGTTDIYPAYTLSKITTTDERGKKIVEYRNTDDRVILKKQQLAEGGALTENHDGWLCTYYVYDDLGRMRFMITPKAVQQISGSWVIGQAIADGLCYSYTYDSKARLIEKKLPDSNPVYMVYDNRERLIFSQDGNQKAGKTNSLNIPEWTFILYDAQNRQVAIGIMRDNSSAPYTRSSLQAFIDNPTYILGEKSFTIQTNVVESITAFNPVPVFSSNGPVISFYDIKINSVKYYDGLTAGQYISETLGYASNFENMDAPTPSNRNRALQTGTKARVLDGSANKFLASTTVFDEKGRVLQSKTTNYLNSDIRLTNQYDFAGKLRSTLYREVKPTGGYTETYTILSKFELDHTGRVKQIKKNVTRSVSGPVATTTTTGERTVVENTYDELGQLASKKLAPGYSGPNGPYLENLVYEYNIRGWMISINKNYVTSSSSAGAFFGMELGYDKGGSHGFYNTILNGNVAGMAWKTAGDNTARRLDYTYDNANRLTSATFKQWTGSAWTNTDYNFSVPAIQYDFNGNITRMEQMGVNFNGIVPMDQMTYGYDNTSNKLKWVAEDVNTDYKLNDFTDNNAGASNNDYTYDDNGNLVEDKNKGIGIIQYNYLNLPERIDFNNNRGNIKYIYDAAGNKLQKITTENEQVTGGVWLTTTTTYSGPIVYTGSDAYLMFEEGRVRFATRHTPNTPPVFTFDYFIKDNLGNTRMVLTEDTQSDQYPAATMESNTSGFESKYYKISNWTDKPVELQGNSAYDQRYGQKMSKLTTQAGGHKIGPSILLKVMAGDVVNAKTDYYFKDIGTQINSTTLLNDLANSLLIHLNAGQAGATAKAQSSTINNSVTTNGVVGSLITSQNSTYDASKPKAYLNYIVFDEQFKAVDKGFIQVQSNGALQAPLTKTDIPVTKNGWIYVFVNNESQQPVYFDNFQVTHVRGNILEETHYYPFGLTMRAISPRALSVNPLNWNKYNGKELQQEEFSDGTGLDVYDFGARMFDPQIGRWQGIDPQAEDFPNVSPYSYAVNNPTLYIDKDGKFVNLILQYGINVGINITVQMLTAYMFDPHVNSWGEAWDKVSIWDAVWEGGMDMIGSKKLRMVTNGVKGMFDYIGQVGLKNVTVSGLLTSGLIGILEPIIGDAVAKYGGKAALWGLSKILSIGGKRSLGNAIKYVWDHVDDRLRGKVFEGYFATTSYKAYEYVGELKRGYFPYFDFYDKNLNKAVSMKTTMSKSGFSDIRDNIKDLARIKGSFVEGRKVDIAELHIVIPQDYDIANLNAIFRLANNAGVTPFIIRL